MGDVGAPESAMERRVVPVGAVVLTTFFALLYALRGSIAAIDRGEDPRWAQQVVWSLAMWWTCLPLLPPLAGVMNGTTEGGVDELGRYRVTWKPARIVRGRHVAPLQPQERREDDADCRHEERVQETDEDGLAVGRAGRAEGEQRLADVEAGCIVEEVEARGDPRPRLRAGAGCGRNAGQVARRRRPRRHAAPQRAQQRQGIGVEAFADEKHDVTRKSAPRPAWRRTSCQRPSGSAGRTAR
mgnify:CR=1 FL=1